MANYFKKYDRSGDVNTNLKNAVVYKNIKKYPISTYPFNELWNMEFDMKKGTKEFLFDFDGKNRI